MQIGFLNRMSEDELPSKKLCGRLKTIVELRVRKEKIRIREGIPSSNKAPVSKKQEKKRRKI